MPTERICASFFQNDALDVAPKLLGMQLVRRLDNGQLIQMEITDIEVYKGEDDLACHASKGKTERTQIMYATGGKIYVYLIYGIHWLLNITTGKEGMPQAILIRGTKELAGPGRIGRFLQLDKSFYGEDISTSDRLWLQTGKTVDKKDIELLPRVGVDFAGDYWANILWRWRVRDL